MPLTIIHNTLFLINCINAQGITAHIVCRTLVIQPFPKRQILDPFKRKVFADDNFKLDENGRKFSQPEENTRKKRNCSLRAISPFPAVFSKN